MNKRAAIIQSLFMVALFAVPSLAADEEAQEGSDSRDCASGIALR